MSICSTVTFPPLRNCDHVVVSVSIDFPSNSQQDALFHCIAYDYSLGDWDGLCDHLRDVFWKDIFKDTVINVVPNADIFRYSQFSTDYGRTFT